MPRNEGRNRFRRWQNSVFRRVALYSMPGCRIRHRKAHVRGFPAHVEFAQPGREQGIVLFIEYDKAGVDRNVAAIVVDQLGVGMPPDTGVGLENDDLVVSGKMPGRIKTGHAGTDDDNFSSRRLDPTGLTNPDRQPASDWFTNPTKLMALSM